MTIGLGPLDLAKELAKIASNTTDSDTGNKIMEVVQRLLEAAGLEPDDLTHDERC